MPGALNLLTTIEENETVKDPALNPVHPGEVLAKDFLEPMALSQYRLAKDIHVPARRINEIVLGKRGITADTALRLARYFDTSADVWLTLQTRYELDTARLAEGRIIERSIHPAMVPTLIPA